MVDDFDVDYTSIDLTINYKLTAIDFLFQFAKVRLIILTETFKVVFFASPIWNYLYIGFQKHLAV